MDKDQKVIKPINYKDAANFIRDIQSPMSRGVNSFLNFNSGGTFELRKISSWMKQSTFDGIMCWYCLDKNNFFIALEPKFNYTYIEQDIADMRPSQENLLLPFEMITDSLYSDPYLDGNLPTYNPIHKNPNPTTEATNSSVSVWVENYLQARGGIKGVNPCSYFVALNPKNPKPYLEEFFRIPGLNKLRYFFGYEDKLNIYSVRLILAPVDQTGSNISTSLLHILGNNDLLQYSWPPQTEGTKDGSK